jgi:hypothetical protein
MPLHSIMPLFEITNQNINAAEYEAKQRSGRLDSRDGSVRPHLLLTPSAALKSADRNGEGRDRRHPRPLSRPQ